jgi:SAM-dependent methyltransferase
MRLGPVPQNVMEVAALASGAVPTPLLDTLVALLLARTVMTATAIGVFDALADGPLALDVISTRCGTDPGATERLLRALCGCHYLDWESDRYELAPVARRWLLRDRPHSLAPAIMHRSLDLRFMAFESYVRNGRSQDFHDQLTQADWELYHAGQASHAELLIGAVLERVPVSRDATDLLDLGGGHGLLAAAFCKRYAALRARVIDLATTVAQRSPETLPELMRNRIQFEVGDIRTASLPERAYDVVLLANVVHHFDEPTNWRLMETAAHALRDNGVLVVVDAVRPKSVRQLTQVEGLLDLYFGAISGAGLWAVEDIRRWMTASRLALLPVGSIRKMPFCKIQIGRKA